MGGLSPRAIAATFPVPPRSGMSLSRALSHFAQAGQGELSEEEVIRLLLSSGRAVISHRDLSLFPPSDPERDIVQLLDAHPDELSGGWLYPGDGLVSLLGPFRPAFDCAYSFRDEPLALGRRPIAPALLRARSSLHSADRRAALLLLDSGESGPEGGLSAVECPELCAAAAASPGSAVAARLDAEGRMCLELRRKPPEDVLECSRALLTAARKRAAKLLPAGLDPSAYAMSAVLECLPAIPGAVLPPLSFLSERPAAPRPRPLLLQATLLRSGASKPIAADESWDLGGLSEALCGAFGWSGAKLHCFRIRGEFFGRRDEHSLPFEHDESSTTLGALVLGPDDVVEYEYDFDAPAVLRIRLA